MMIERQANGVTENAFGAAAPVARLAIGDDLGVVVVLLSIELLVLGLITEGCGPPS